MLLDISGITKIVKNILIAYTILLAVIYIILLIIVFTHTHTHISRRSCSTKITCIQSQFNLFVEKTDFVAGKISYLIKIRGLIKKSIGTVSIKRKIQYISIWHLICCEYSPSEFTHFKQRHFE